ncbi:MAG: methyltransferase domain-containing protein [Mycobacteriales bacterium]
MEPADDSPYWRFYDAVAAAQLAEWLPPARSRVLDLSGRQAASTAQLLAAGHDVLGVRPVDGKRGPTQWPVVADPLSLAWLRDASVDAVLAEGNMLSLCLAAELAVEDLLRVLRPGGRLLLVVDSLLLGLARLADQERWAELADVPAADVVLVPERSGAITRCFWPEELEALLSNAGFAVDWIRPRSVLAPAAVERALRTGHEGALQTLVQTETALARAREGASTGLHLVASARKPD